MLTEGADDLVRVSPEKYCTYFDCGQEDQLTL